MARLDNILKYEHYQAEDFISDTFFLEWVTSPTNMECNIFWSRLMEAYPNKCTEIDMARAIILHHTQGEGLDEKEEEDLWQKINRSLLS